MLLVQKTYMKTSIFSQREGSKILENKTKVVLSVWFLFG